MVYARALRALECITHAGPSPALGTFSTYLNFGDEFDGRMSALGAEGTGFNSRVPDKLIIFLISSKLRYSRKKVI